MTRQGVMGLVVLTGCVLAMAAAAAAPYLWEQVASETLAEKQNELRFLQAKSKRAKIAPTLALPEGTDIGPMFVEGTTAGLSLAALQQIVSQKATENGLALERTQPLQSDGKGAFPALRIEIEATGSLDSLKSYLVALEGGLPYITVKEAKISAPQSAGDDKSVLPSDKLTVALQLEAFGQAEPKP